MTRQTHCSRPARQSDHVVPAAACPYAVRGNKDTDLQYIEVTSPAQSTQKRQCTPYRSLFPDKASVSISPTSSPPQYAFAVFSFEVLAVPVPVQAPITSVQTDLPVVSVYWISSLGSALTEIRDFYKRSHQKLSSDLLPHTPDNDLSPLCSVIEPASLPNSAM